MFEEIKAQMEVNQQKIKDTKISFKERVYLSKKKNKNNFFNPKSLKWQNWKLLQRQNRVN